MDNGVRRGFLIAGAAIGLFGFAIPGVYSVTFSPPPGSPSAKVDLPKLDGFNGFFAVQTGAIYNGFNGPANLHVALVALGIMAVLALASLAIDLDSAAGIAKVVQPGWLSGALTVAATFIWAFRFDRTPPSIRDKLIADLGGGPDAVAAAQYLNAQLGLGALILLFGLLVGAVGASPRLGGTLLGLFCLTFLVLCIVGQVVH